MSVKNFYLKFDKYGKISHFHSTTPQISDFPFQSYLGRKTMQLIIYIRNTFISSGFFYNFQQLYQQLQNVMYAIEVYVYSTYLNTKNSN